MHLSCNIFLTTSASLGNVFFCALDDGPNLLIFFKPSSDTLLLFLSNVTECTQTPKEHNSTSTYPLGGRRICKGLRGQYLAGYLAILRNSLRPKSRNPIRPLSFMERGGESTFKLESFNDPLS